MFSISQDDLEKFSKFAESIIERFDWHKTPQTDSEAALKDLRVASAPTGFTSIQMTPFTFLGVRYIAKEGIVEQYFLEVGPEFYALGQRVWNNKALEVPHNA